MSCPIHYVLCINIRIELNHPHSDSNVVNAHDRINIDISSEKCLL